MAHFEDTNCRPTRTVVRNGTSVSFFACGITNDDDGPYEIERTTTVDDQDFVYKIAPSTGKVHPTYKRSNVDRDCLVFLFTFYDVRLGDRFGILYNGQQWSEPIHVVDGGIPRNVWQLKHAPDEVRQKALFDSSTPIEAVPINSRPAAPKFRGLAIHVTAGEQGAAAIVKNTWKSTGVAAHFVIERKGRLVQCMSLMLTAEAQGGPGDPNPQWISVEFVCGMNNGGTNGYIDGDQIVTCSRLFKTLAVRFGFPPQLARPLINDQTGYSDISKALAAKFGVAGANSRAEAQASFGLSCHRWLGPGHACPGLIGLRIMPDILDVSRIKDQGIDFEM